MCTLDFVLFAGHDVPEYPAFPTSPLFLVPA
jgi:hypothetical protein